LTKDHSPDPIDVHVGARIRRRRKLLDQSQQDLAQALGVTFQQVQKYERGANRISASMMARAAKAQGVEPAYYFEGLDLEGKAPTIPGEMQAALTYLQSAEALPLAAAVAALPPALRQSVTAMARSLEGVAV
jgi:transcriptional regulator with XRE-family HTH domain